MQVLSMSTGTYLVVEECHRLEVEKSIHSLACRQVVQLVHFLAHLRRSLLANVGIDATDGCRDYVMLPRS